MTRAALLASTAVLPPSAFVILSQCGGQVAEALSAVVMVPPALAMSTASSLFPPRWRWGA